ncbi:NosD domain-containing protein [Methanococcoides seepicolus]|uniref:Periplasmic copper-binding protein NosD beta helix domain-containing protein n=1 Tax=Methanococcoides seepicolus TaxID=2828780 RepID=A0A9E4ZG26_9EURY|nr:NosD domain-containing protein [Methanococcoides seepicolus]MCM1987062.1 hypothetical protein [Methanococcoides seepicolus]
MRSMKIIGLLLIVSLLSITVLAAPALGADEITAIRSFDTSTIASGETVRVTVDITTSTLVDAPALEEDIPAGWTLTEVDSAGWTKNEDYSQWVGPMGGLPAGSAVTIVYDLTPASGDIGTYSVAGTVSGAYDVVSNPPLGTPTSSTVAGATDITVESSSINVYDGDSLPDVVAAALDGDTIYLHAGSYDCYDYTAGSYLDIHKSLSLIGDGPGEVSLYYVNENEISIDSDAFSFTLEGVTLSNMSIASRVNNETYINNCVLDTVDTAIRIYEDDGTAYVGNCVMPEVAVSGSAIVENCNISGKLMLSTSSTGIIRNNEFGYMSGSMEFAPGETVIIENNTITGLGTGGNARPCMLNSNLAGIIFRNNYITNGCVLIIPGNVEVTGNTFIGGAPAIYRENGATNTISGNTFDTCAEAIRFDGSSSLGGGRSNIYLNNFINVDVICTDIDVFVNSESDWQSPDMNYTYQGVLYNGPLGNYYDDYTAAHAGQGIGDTPVVHPDLGNDSYPLMGEWDATNGRIEFIVPATDEMAAVRSFDTNDVMAGDTVRVSVEITTGPDKTVEDLVLDEDILAGWTIAEVDSAGWVYNAAQNQWLGPINGLPTNSTVTIVYNLTSDAGAGTAIYHPVTGKLSGKVDIDQNSPLGTSIRSAVVGQTDISLTHDSVVHLYDGDDLAATLENSFTGDTIYLHAGNYYLQSDESRIYLDHGLSIIGDGADVVNIADKEIRFNEGDNFTIENVTMSRLSLYGDFHSDVVLRDCVFTNRFYVYRCTNLVVKDCVSTDYSYVKECTNVVIENNDLQSKGYLQTLTNATIKGNTFAGLQNSIDGENCTVQGNAFTDATSGYSKGLAIKGTGIEILDNTFAGVLRIKSPCEAYVNGNTFRGAPGLRLESEGVNVVITENTFDSCSPTIEFKNDISGYHIYLNNFIGNSDMVDKGVDPGNATFESPAMDYTFQGVTYNGPLGNYYDNYAGAYAGEGTGDTPVVHTGFGTDNYPLMGAWDAATNTIEFTPSFVPGDASVIEGQETEIQIMASVFPAGLSGYNLSVVIDDPTVAEIVDVEYPVWASIVENSSMPGTSIYLTALDGSSQIEAGAEDVVLATLTVSGKDLGLTGLTLSVEGLDDDSGTAIDTTLSTGALEVTMTPVRGKTVSPQDLNGDGRYEDLNGDGQFGFVDVEVFFSNKEWIGANMPVECSDFNGNGRTDFDDIVDLFELV